MMSKFNWLKTGNYFIYAEHCPGLFGFAYMGWWLYAAPIVDGEARKDQAVWLKCDWELDAVLAGLGIPKPASYIGGGHSEYTEAFMAKYPDGVFCNVEGYAYTCKVTNNSTRTVV